ncbi:circadian clock protein KaiC [Methylomagnum sp.]
MLPASATAHPLPKTPTGIQGLDEITLGGLPTGRSTLVCGGPGCGKTLLGIEFLARGILHYNEPGVLMAFEESAEELTANVASLGYDLGEMHAEGRLFIDHVRVDRAEIEETGEYDLEGLFIRLADAIGRVGAKRVVLDTLESLFVGLNNEAILRAELRRLFRWLKDRGVTTLITAERGEGQLTRHGLEEYVSDCVILLDFRVREEISTRRLRVVKYRGTHHGTNEYPFLIDERGISVYPVTSLRLDQDVSDERVSTGVARLDAMLGGLGVYRGSSVLVTGTAGTGKSSLAARFAAAACDRGERALYFAFEESPNQIARNMRSIGVDLRTWVERERLRFFAARPTSAGLETQLATMFGAIERFQPGTVVVDPITNLVDSGTPSEIRSMLTRLIDFLKNRQITALFTSLTIGRLDTENTELRVSSVMDTWIGLRALEEGNGERNRILYVLKSRGMAHSNQIREFRLSDAGIELVDCYLGPMGVLTGTARYAQEVREEADAAARREALEARRRAADRRRQALEAQILALQAEIESEEDQILRLAVQTETNEGLSRTDRAQYARLRQADSDKAMPWSGAGA